MSIIIYFYIKVDMIRYDYTLSIVLSPFIRIVKTSRFYSDHFRHGVKGRWFSHPRGMWHFTIIRWQTGNPFIIIFFTVRLAWLVWRTRTYHTYHTYLVVRYWIEELRNVVWVSDRRGNCMWRKQRVLGHHRVDVVDQLQIILQEEWEEKDNTVMRFSKFSQSLALFADIFAQRHQPSAAIGQGRIRAIK